MAEIQIEFDVPAQMRDGTVLRADVTGPDGVAGAGGGADGAARRGGGGGGDRSPGAPPPGKIPRDDGGGGMRDVGTALPSGRGTTLTGRGTMLGGADGAVSETAEALGSFSSPIESLAARAPPHAPRL